MAVVLWAMPLGYEHLNLLTDQFVSCVTKHRLCLGVDLDDDSLLVDSSNGVGNRL
jgi:hypothetical protein